MATPCDFPTTPVSQTFEIHSSSAGHSRNLSTVSSNTLHTATNTTLHSTPYEPLLPPIPVSQSSSDAYEVALSRHSRPSLILSLARWSQSNMRSKHSSPNEKVSSKENLPQNKRENRLKLGKRILEVVLGTFRIIFRRDFILTFS